MVGAGLKVTVMGGAVDVSSGVATVTVTDSAPVSVEKLLSVERTRGGMRPRRTNERVTAVASPVILA
ncbi:MAG: hypothetical protein BWY99_01616 [Synergistetes bacterium ADurb.BinA166]|nr:MAG: hypothetical protein BWY99_01616 [Synergistetes bacterium ADurb.BinA166]